MANSLRLSPVLSFNTPDKSRLISDRFSSRKVCWAKEHGSISRNDKRERLKVKAADSKPATKANSIICADCEGNGAVTCSQCKGGGVNIVDHFNGQFKAGAMCWLCRGKKEVLCGNCNGAGFIGGFMSTFDD